MTIPEDVKLLEDERIDDLQRCGLMIIQNTKKFCFGIDAVLLSSFANAKKGEKLIDLGTGTGIIPIIMQAKTQGSHFTGLEIQEEMADMAARSVRMNHQENVVKIVKGDIKEVKNLFTHESFDVVTSNPPYMNEDHGIRNPMLPKAIARHEILCSLEDVVSAAAYLLRAQGRFYMVHRPSRLSEIMETLIKYRLEPKRIKFVHPFVDKDANLVLIESVKGGGRFMKIEKPLIVYERPGVYMQEIYDIYGY